MRCLSQRFTVEGRVNLHALAVKGGTGLLPEEIRVRRQLQALRQVRFE